MSVHRWRILTQKREALFVVTSELAPRCKHVGYISHVCRQTTDNKFSTFNCRIVADARVCSAAELKQRKRLIFQRRLNIYILTRGEGLPRPRKPSCRRWTESFFQISPNPGPRLLRAFVPRRIIPMARFKRDIKLGFYKRFFFYQVYVFCIYIFFLGMCVFCVV